MGCSSFSGDLIMDNSFDIELANIEYECNQLGTLAQNEIDALKSIDFKNFRRHSSSVDAWDFCFGVAIGYLALSITTDEELSLYLEDIHKAASGVSGNFDKIQDFFGKLLYHKGDHIDIVEKNFKNRKGENAYGAFHRLLWGHDVLSTHGDNPFVLMIEQRGLSGILQAFQHLIADTASKQGLPLPGSSYLDFEKENGCMSNYLIKISENLSEQSVGNKFSVQSIYSHMFTIRAQDIAGNATIECLIGGYFKLRGIKNAVRIAQIKLIAYSIAFWGHTIIGMLRQNGVPYVNISELKELISNLVKLDVESRRETKQIIANTTDCIAESEHLIEEVNDTTRYLDIQPSNADYAKELQRGQENVVQLLGFFAKGEGDK